MTGHTLREIEQTSTGSVEITGDGALRVVNGAGRIVVSVHLTPGDWRALIAAGGCYLSGHSGGRNPASSQRIT